MNAPRQLMWRGDSRLICSCRGARKITAACREFPAQMKWHRCPGQLRGHGCDAVIDRAAVLDLLFNAVPSFRESAEFAEMNGDYVGDDGQTLLYAVAVQLVRHVSALNVAESFPSIDALLALTESLIIERDDYVSELAIVGILEDLQNTSLHADGSSPEDFERFLRPWSRWWWDELNLLWGGQLTGHLGSSGRARPPGMPDPDVS